MRLLAPAKINLGLRILGTRDDGYHLIESLFVPIDLADELVVEVEDEGVTQPSVDLRVVAEAGGAVDGADPIPEDERNLAWRAARDFLARSGLPARVSIELRKRVPSAAGLGGGSSDAAAVLRCLVERYPDALPQDDVFAIALGLGADVPFFLAPEPALVSGIGERIDPVGGLPSLALLLVNPGDSLATAQVYGAYDVLAASLTPIEPGSTMRAVSDLRDSKGKGERALADCLDDLLINDLELAARRMCPPIGRLQRELLARGALAAGMSGSGATVFGIFPDEERSREALERGSFGKSSWACVAGSVGSTS
jgi:4-diphosphocytidyl-2-C-methyl-D-erythritol kinase